MGDASIDYDNLVVKMGLLKCGHRYRVVVEIPDYWKRKDDDANSTVVNNKAQDHGDASANALEADLQKQEQKVKREMETLHLDEQEVVSSSHTMNVRIVEDSLDGDLQGEIQEDLVEEEGESGAADSNNNNNAHHVCITLSARRRGPYRGRFVIELTRVESKGQSTTTDSKQDVLSCSNSLSNPTKAIDKKASSSSKKMASKCLMSLQVDATIMGKDMGTPKLRNGVHCLGKMVGYDSDDETEWQGFD